MASRHNPITISSSSSDDDDSGRTSTDSDDASERKHAHAVSARPTVTLPPPPAAMPPVLRPRPVSGRIVIEIDESDNDGDEDDGDADADADARVQVDREYSAEAAAADTRGEDAPPARRRVRVPVPPPQSQPPSQRRRTSAAAATAPAAAAAAAAAPMPDVAMETLRPPLPQVYPDVFERVRAHRWPQGRRPPVDDEAEMVKECRLSRDIVARLRARGVRPDICAVLRLLASNACRDLRTAWGLERYFENAQQVSAFRAAASRLERGQQRHRSTRLQEDARILVQRYFDGLATPRAVKEWVEAIRGDATNVHPIYELCAANASVFAFDRAAQEVLMAKVALADEQYTLLFERMRA